MQLTLADSEAKVLRTAVKYRLDKLMRSLGDADALNAKQVLRSEVGTLEAIYNQLGCVHEPGTMTASCTYIEDEDSPERWLGDAD